MSEYRLEMCDVVKTFPGVKALNHAQLKLKPGTVHALMGENGAGKSTLMKCMFGIYHMDEGKVIYEGQEVQIKGPLDALNRGIAMVHQELQPIPERSIGENIYVGRYPTKKYGPVTVIDHDKMYEDAAKVLKEVHLNYDPHAKLGTLSVSQMQLVEIAKAVSADCKVLILDEPTSSLTAAEVEALFTIVNELRAKGDTGSMFFGGIVTALAFVMQRPELVLFFGIVYIWDAMTVVIQRTYFKATHGKRIFRMTPIHHAFEMRGWREVKIDGFFALIAVIGVAMGIFYICVA